MSPSIEDFDTLPARAGALLRLGRTEMGLTMERCEPIAGASQPTLSRAERGENIWPLTYAIRLAKRVPAVRDALAEMIGASLASIPAQEDRRLAEFAWRLAVARKRADWNRIEATLDAVLPSLRQSDKIAARQEIAALLEALRGGDGVEK